MFTEQMFIGAEVLLDLGFEPARSRLVSLLRSDALLTASQDSYGEGTVGLARVGPLGPVPGMSRLVEVKFRDPVMRDDSVVVVLRWEAIGPDGGLFPALDADLTLAPAGADSTSLRLVGAYRPPLGALGAQLDRVILNRVANATAEDFLDRVAAAIRAPAPMAGPVSGKQVQKRNQRRRPWRPPPSTEVS